MRFVLVTSIASIFALVDFFVRCGRHSLHLHRVFTALQPIIICIDKENKKKLNKSQYGTFLHFHVHQTKIILLMILLMFGIFFIFICLFAVLFFLCATWIHEVALRHTRINSFKNVNGARNWLQYRIWQNNRWCSHRLATLKPFFFYCLFSFFFISCNYYLITVRVWVNIKYVKWKSTRILSVIKWNGNYIDWPPIF